MQFLSLKSLCLTIYGTDKRLVVNAGCKAYEAILSKIIECSIDFLLTDKDDENNPKAINASAQECYDFIKGCGFFYLATAVKNLPHLRPMELIYSDEKHLYFGTYRKKNVYKEIFENPNIEISSFDLTSYKWIRIEGKAEILTPESVSKELKQVFHFRTSVKDEATENIIVKVHIKSVSMN